MYHSNELGMVRETAAQIVQDYASGCADAATELLAGTMSVWEFHNVVDSERFIAQEGLGLRMRSARYIGGFGWCDTSGMPVDMQRVRKDGAKALDMLLALG